MDKVDNAGCLPSTHSPTPFLLPNTTSTGLIPNSPFQIDDFERLSSSPAPKAGPGKSTWNILIPFLLPGTGSKTQA